MPDIQGTEAGEVLTSDGSAITLRGEGGDDLLYGYNPNGLGYSGESTLLGGDGADILISSGAGGGFLSGGDGDDHIIDAAASASLGDPASIAFFSFVQGGGHTIDGGAGDDTLYISLTDRPGVFDFSPVIFNNFDASAVNAITIGGNVVSTFTGIENLWVISGYGDDQLSGGDGDDVLIGGLGDDIIYGGAGDDILGGLAGVLRVGQPIALRGTVSTGFDILDGGDGVDLGLLFYTSAADAIVFDSSNADGVNSVMVGGVEKTTITRVDRISIWGGEGNDQFTAGDLDDTLAGGRGTDTLIARGGDDLLIGGDGDDMLNGGGGSDTAEYADASAGVTVSLSLAGAQNTVGAGTDTLVGIENLTGSGHADILTGDAGANLLMGGAGADLLFWTPGGDTLDGDESVDQGYVEEMDTVSFAAATAGLTVSLAVVGPQAVAGSTATLIDIENLTGSTHADSLIGDGADNVLDGGGGDDHLDGGSGVDTASYASALGGVTVNLSVTTSQATGNGADTLVAIENLKGSAFGDVLTGDAEANTLDGGAGADRLDGGAGANLLLGGAGDDYLISGVGAEVMRGGDGVDTVSYENAAAGVTVNAFFQSIGDGYSLDTFFDTENFVGSRFNDILTGATSNGALYGGDGDDTLDGNYGDDLVDGGNGNDTLRGGAGDDRLVGGIGNDTAIYSGTQDAVTVSLAIAGAQAVGGGQGTDTLISIENLTGSIYGDTLTGDAHTNVLDGAEGDDSLYGGDGDDTLVGGFGDDSFYGGAGIDTASYAAAERGVGVSLGFDGEWFNTTGVGYDRMFDVENLIGSAFGDVLYGGAGANAIYGGAGSDLLQGDLGDDLLDGGSSLDVASYTSASTGVTVNLTASGAQNTGGAGVDTLVSIEGVYGSDHNDALVGDDASNLFDGGLGDDTLDGAGGFDVASYGDAASAVQVDLRIVTGQDTGGAGTDTLLSIEDVYGSDFNDTLVGEVGDNYLYGAGGSDVLYGLGGDDELDGGGHGTDAPDYLYGGAGDDVYYVESSLTGPLDLVFEGGTNPDLMAGADDFDTIYSYGDFFWDYYGVAENLVNERSEGSQIVGGVNSQTIYGDDGTDLISAYGGSNYVDAGAGTDAVSFSLYGLDESYDGANTLAMKPGSGIDYVYEFESGVDKIDLTAFHFGITGQQVLDQAVNVDQAGTANDYCYFYLTNAGGVDNYVAFIGLLSSQLQAGDFIT